MSRFVLPWALVACILVPVPTVAPAQPVVRQKYLRKGYWRTVETFVNSSATLVFLGPACCQVKLVSFPGTGGNQRQALDGVNLKTVKVGGARGLFGRVQVRVPADTTARYVVWPGDLVLSFQDLQKALELLRRL
jgi:hypothetical protein